MIRSSILLLRFSSQIKLIAIADGSGSHNTIKERAKYIPIRLSLGERKMLRLVESAMTCCDYTSEVDRPFKSAARRTHAQLKGVTSVLRGLVTACDYSKGQVRSLPLDVWFAFSSRVSMSFLYFRNFLRTIITYSLNSSSGKCLRLQDDIRL
jgi:hypothetical protein